MYLPPNLVGLKISWPTVAIAVTCQALHLTVASVLEHTS